ncbi:MAG TPA: hypothetical protein VGK74_17190 [Symbiobacteriaceae bacterium]
MPTGLRVQVLDLATQQERTTVSKAEHWAASSPDGRFLAGFTQHGEREDPKTGLAPSDLIIHDLQTHQEQVFPDAAQVGVRHSEAPPVMRMAWSADSKPYWKSLNPTTGTIADATSPPDVPPAYAPPPPLPPGPTGWTVAQPQGWGAITLKGPQGQTRAAGEGLALGWRPDGSLLVLRWPNAAHRRNPGI